MLEFPACFFISKTAVSGELMDVIITLQAVFLLFICNIGYEGSGQSV